MSALASRLKTVEARLHLRVPLAEATVVLFYDQLEPCLLHPRCDVEVATGRHVTGIIHLSLDMPRR